MWALKLFGCKARRWEGCPPMWDVPHVGQPYVPNLAESTLGVQQKCAPVCSFSRWQSTCLPSSGLESAVISTQVPPGGAWVADDTATFFNSALMTISLSRSRQTALANRCCQHNSSGKTNNAVLSNSQDKLMSLLGQSTAAGDSLVGSYEIQHPAREFRRLAPRWVLEDRWAGQPAEWWRIQRISASEQRLHGRCSKLACPKEHKGYIVKLQGPLQPLTYKKINTGTF